MEESTTVDETNNDTSNSRHRLYYALINLDRLSKFDDSRSTSLNTDAKESSDEVVSSNTSNCTTGPSTEVVNSLDESQREETETIYQIECDNHPSPREMYFTLKKNEDGKFQGEWTENNKKLL